MFGESAVDATAEFERQRVTAGVGALGLGERAVHANGFASQDLTEDIEAVARPRVAGTESEGNRIESRHRGVHTVGLQAGSVTSAAAPRLRQNPPYTSALPSCIVKPLP